MIESLPAVETAKQEVLEHQQRLSRSLLWDLQREYFDRRGVDEWRE